jgi:hypothetical protein
MTSKAGPFVFFFGLTVLLYGVVFYYLWRVVREHQDIWHSTRFPKKKKLRMILNLLIRSSDIHMTVLVLTVLFASNLISLLLLGTMIFDEKIPEYYLAFTATLSSPILALCGLVQYVREETPGNMGSIIRGPWAIFMGGALMAIGYGISVISFIYGIVIWIK